MFVLHRFLQMSDILTFVCRTSGTLFSETHSITLVLNLRRTRVGGSANPLVSMNCLYTQLNAFPFTSCNFARLSRHLTDTRIGLPVPCVPYLRTT